MGKKFFLTNDQLESKIERIESKIADMTGPENKRKRKKFYELLSKLKKAKLNPEKYIVDPVKLAERKKIDQERRKNKKLQKKQQLIKDIKSEKKKLSKKKCLICRELGHIAADCDQKYSGNNVDNENNQNNENVGNSKMLCYYCGSNKHRLSECTKKKMAEKDGAVNELPYATCFICKQQGHISRDCDQNEKGIYIKGGSCHYCQSVRHLAKDCPKNPQKELNKQRKIKKRLVKSQFKSQQNDLGDDEELTYLDNDQQQDLEEEPEF